MSGAYVGIDNGVTGSLALLNGRVQFRMIPTRTEQSYTKKKQQITRVLIPELINILNTWVNTEWVYAPDVGHNFRVFIERPFVNPHGFKATASALRALEATLIAVEQIGLSYQYVDSREWQKVMLPAGIKGTPDLKRASVDIGCRLFPQYADSIRKHKDADSLLIAEWARRRQL